MIEALCIGHAAWDVSVWMPGFPEENSKSEVQTLVECSGGPAANAACLLARWGVRTAFAGVLGRDSTGERVIASLNAAGVDVSAVHTSEHCPTPVSVILVNEQSGSRTVINRSAPVSTRPALDFNSVKFDGSPRLLLFDGHELDASLRAMERFPNALTVLDAGSLREGTSVLAEQVQFLVASERFAQQVANLTSLDTAELWQQAIAALHALNGRPVIITLGERGLIHGTADQWIHLSAFRAKPVDTTGAGDIFHGAFAYGLLRALGWEYTLRLASMAGACSVEQRGSSASIPTRESVEASLSAAASEL
ncbi:carbohydrate kinase family protein [Verrucomicrobiota bacterium sgz303538]